ncbi:MAG: hypothetical protein CSA33_03035 [Desulfobulbus propionicus]|nr:MAG: hypothetical protein CSA33_03035 [Desulfobulbus propionicus]
MIWQYRTIVFEFVKDGLLGDRYIDDEEMETTLNEQGLSGWELVDVVMIQEGVLAVLKRAQEKPADSQVVLGGGAVAAQMPGQRGESAYLTEATETRRQLEEPAYTRSLEEKGTPTRQEQRGDRIGEIKIR